MKNEIKLPRFNLNEEQKINLMAGAVYVSYQPASYFGQPWSLKDKKHGLTIHVGGFDGAVDFDLFGDLVQVTGAEESTARQSLPLQEEGPSVTVRGASRYKKCVGLIRLNFRQEGQVAGSAAIALKFWRGRIDLLPLPYADYAAASAITGRGGPDADWHFESGLSLLAETSAD